METLPILADDPKRPSDKRYLTHRQEFGQFAYDFSVQAPLVSTDTLLNIHLRINGYRRPNNNTPPNPVCPDEVRVYLNEHDVTPSVLHVLRGMIDADSDRIYAEYRAALDRWIVVLRSHPHIPRNPDDEEAAAAALIATTPLSDVLTQLGDRDVGFAGNLHLFNYLYSEIDIPPISLAAVVDHAGIDLRNLSEPRLSFSYGPHSVYTAGWQPPANPGGDLRIEILFEYHNPLNDVVDDLFQRIDDLRHELLQAIDTLRTELLAHIGELRNDLDLLLDEVLPRVEKIDQTFWIDDSRTSSGEDVQSLIKHYLLPIDTALAGIDADIGEWGRSIISHARHLDGLARKARELKDAIDAL